MEKNCEQFSGKLVKMIRDTSRKFGDYSISPKNQTNYIGVMN